MRLHLSRIHFPVTTLGFGRRVGIWFQGCSIRCPGCISPDTWDPAPGQTTVDETNAAIAPWLSSADGVTISGGEPFDQPAALQALLVALRPRINGDVLVFTGYELAAVSSSLDRFADTIDTLITGPFDARAGQTLTLRGSDNQEVYPLTPLGRARYAALAHQPRAEGERNLDLHLSPTGELWLAGIPKPGDIERLRRALGRYGFSASTRPTHADDR